MDPNAMDTAGSVVSIAILAAVTIALLAAAIREVVIARATSARVEAWRRAGVAREPGIVILRGRAWSDEEAPVAAVPVNIVTTSNRGSASQVEEGPAKSRPFWLSTDEGDVAVDARPELTVLIAPKLADAPFGHVMRLVPVGADVEVYGRLAREHVPGVATDGFRDAAASWSLHGDENEKLRLAHGTSVAPGVAERRIYAFFVAAATVGWTIASQAALAGAEADLLTGRGPHLEVKDVTRIFMIALILLIAVAISVGWRRLSSSRA